MLAVINIRDKRYEYYDSLGHSGNAVLRNLRLWLQDYAHTHPEQLDLGQSSLSTWTDYRPTPVLKQLNGFDCGMFLIQFASYVASDMSLDGSPFRQGNIDTFRSLAGKAAASLQKQFDAQEAAAQEVAAQEVQDEVELVAVEDQQQDEPVAHQDPVAAESTPPAAKGEPVAVEDQQQDEPVAHQDPVAAESTPPAAEGELVAVEDQQQAEPVAHTTDTTQCVFMQPISSHTASSNAAKAKRAGGTLGHWTTYGVKQREKRLKVAQEQSLLDLKSPRSKEELQSVKTCQVCMHIRDHWHV